MSKLIGGILLVVVLAGGYIAINKNKKVEINNKEGDSKVEVSSTKGKKMAFSEFIKNGGSYKCTVHQYFGETDTIGTTYVNSGMISGKYETKVNGMDIVSNVLVRDGYSYSWNSMMKNNGFKVKIIENNQNQQNPSASTSGTYSFDSEQIGDYDCAPVTPDMSMFVIPSSVTFKEIK